MTNYTVDNWRQHLASNHRRTYIIMFLFVSTYIVMGLWLDSFIIMVKSHLNSHDQINSLTEAWKILITTPKVPWATLTLGGIGTLAVLIAILKADRLMLLGTEYHEVTATTASLAEKQLVDIIEEMKIAAGLKFMPKVYIINAPYMNAFASGFSEKSAMIAVTSGLLEKLNRDELEAVMAHEISHIRHLDIKLTLMVSALCNIAEIVFNLTFISLLFGTKSDKAQKKNDSWTSIYFLFFVIGSFLRLSLSRTREFMADDGAIELMRDNQPLAHALIKISDDYQAHASEYEEILQQTTHENVRKEAYIFDPSVPGKWGFPRIEKLFATHPSLEARLNSMKYQSNRYQSTTNPSQTFS